MSATFRFNPDQVAYFEVAGWKAYYDHDWWKLLRLIVRLCQEQFLIPFPMSLLAAYYTVRASASWVPTNHDERMVRWFLERFYRVAQRSSRLEFDPVRVGDLELAYWEIHRRLSGQPDKTELRRSIVDLHAELFQLTTDQAQESAAYRVEAATILDTITSRTSIDPAGDWQRTEECLRNCYRSLARTIGSTP